MDRSTLYFALLFVGLCVMFGGGALWLITADQDYHYEFDYESDTFPRNEGSTDYYDELSETKQDHVDRAIDGEYFVYESEAEMPPPIVKKDGTYYVFNSYSGYDWLDPMTLGPALLGLSGVGMAFEAARRDVRDRR